MEKSQFPSFEEFIKKYNLLIPRNLYSIMEKLYDQNVALSKKCSLLEEENRKLREQISKYKESEKTAIKKEIEEIEKLFEK